MKKTTELRKESTNATTVARIQKMTEKTKEKAVKEARNTAKIKIDFVYNVKAIKIAYSEESKNTLSEYYATKMHLCEVTKKYQNNIGYYMAKIEQLEEAEKLSLEEEKKLHELKLELERSQVCYLYFKKKVNKTLKPILGTVKEDLYNAYVRKMVDDKEWKSQLEDFFNDYKIKMDESLYTFLDRSIGLKSQALSKRDNGQITALSKGVFKTLLFDILTQIAIDKQVLKKKVIEAVLDDSKLVEISEFASVIEIAKPSAKTTVKEYQVILTKIGVPFKKSDKKETLVNLYNQALSHNLFTEVQA